MWDFKICEMCFSRFYANINSSRLIQNIQYFTLLRYLWILSTQGLKRVPGIWNKLATWMKMYQHRNLAALLVSSPWSWGWYGFYKSCQGVICRSRMRQFTLRARLEIPTFKFPWKYIPYLRVFVYESISIYAPKYRVHYYM